MVHPPCTSNTDVRVGSRGQQFSFEIARWSGCGLVGVVLVMWGSGALFARQTYASPLALARVSDGLGAQTQSGSRGMAALPETHLCSFVCSFVFLERVPGHHAQLIISYYSNIK